MVVAGLLSNAKPNDVDSRPGPSSQKRYFRVAINHAIEPSGKQGRCILCKKNTKLACKACDVKLHMSCFKLYHNEDA